MTHLKKGGGSVGLHAQEDLALLQQVRVVQQLPRSFPGSHASQPLARQRRRMPAHANYQERKSGGHQKAKVLLLVQLCMQNQNLQNDFECTTNAAASWKSEAHNMRCALLFQIPRVIPMTGAPTARRAISLSSKAFLIPMQTIVKRVYVSEPWTLFLSRVSLGLATLDFEP